MLDFSENKYRKFIHLSSKMLDLEMIIEKSEMDSYQNSPSFVEVNSEFVMILPYGPESGIKNTIPQPKG